MMARLRERYNAFVLWRERVRLEMRKAMRARGWISDKTMARGYTVKANPSCRKCHGRGYVGVRRDDKAPVLCSCAQAVYEGGNK